MNQLSVLFKKLNLLSPLAETTVKDFRDRSFIEWDFKDQFYQDMEKSLYQTNLQLMFRTRQPSGLLLKAQNAQKSEYLMLEVGVFVLCSHYSHV